MGIIPADVNGDMSGEPWQHRDHTELPLSLQNLMLESQLSRNPGLGEGATPPMHVAHTCPASTTFKDYVN